MAEKRVSVRLSATGGRQVKDALRGVGEAGQQGFRRLSREMEAANRRLARFARQATRIARVVGAAAAAAGAALIGSGLQTIDTQAKLAQSLATTTASVQALARAADLSGSPSAIWRPGPRASPCGCRSSPPTAAGRRPTRSGGYG